MGDLDLTAAITEVLREHRIECTGIEGMTCRACRDSSWMSPSAYRLHVAALIEAQVRAQIAADIEAARVGFDRYPQTRQGDLAFGKDTGLSLAARIARGDA